MKHWNWIAAGAAALVCAAIALNCTWTDPTAALGQAGELLRGLSLSGPAGDALAWALWAALSLLPLLGLLPVRRRRGLSDLFFVLAAAWSLPMWYMLANPGLLLSRFPGGGERVLPVVRLVLVMPTVLLLCGAVMLRCTEGGVKPLLRRTRGLLAVLMCVEAGATAFALASGWRAAAAEGGAAIALAIFQGVCTVAICAAALAAISAAADLVRAMEKGWFTAQREAERLARRAHLQLAITCGAAALQAVAGVAALGRVSVSATADIPLVELLAALACLLLARFVAEGARLKRENDSFV